MNDDIGCEKENKALKRKVRLLEQSLSQFSSIKAGYDVLIQRLEEKDKSLLEMNEKLEFLVNERTKELENVNKQLQYNVKLLEELSRTDPLTSLSNRRAFDETFEKELTRAKRQDYELSFMIIDVDNFKQYNDCYGHDKGDEALKVLGSILNKFSRRANDFSFRYGGEEFVYIGTFQDAEKTLKLANKIKETLEEKSIEHKMSERGYLTISIGAVVSKNINSNIDEIFKIADENLYKSKEEGRNTVTLTVL